MDQIHFTKMHGAGNDYIYVDNRHTVVPEPTMAARIWSDRHKGIGSDGLVLIEDSDLADFRMRIFNADGSEAEMCGNACRCIGKYVFEHRLTLKHDITLETLSGIKHLHLTVKNQQVESVTVDMGSPQDIRPVNVLTDFRQAFSVSMGNPHLVIFVDSVSDLDLEHWGPQLEHHPLFPERTNVEFAEVRSDRVLRMRVWERGSGITLACGTGACATAVAYMQHTPAVNSVRIEMDGGHVQVEWDRIYNRVFLTGPAEETFSGNIQWQQTTYQQNLKDTDIWH